MNRLSMSTARFKDWMGTRGGTGGPPALLLFMVFAGVFGAAGRAEAQGAPLTGSACVYGQACQSVEALATIQHGGSGDIIDTGLANNGSTDARSRGRAGPSPSATSPRPRPCARS